MTFKQLGAINEVPLVGVLSLLLEVLGESSTVAVETVTEHRV